MRHFWTQNQHFWTFSASIDYLKVTLKLTMAIKQIIDDQNWRFKYRLLSRKREYNWVIFFRSNFFPFKRFLFPFFAIFPPFLASLLTLKNFFLPPLLLIFFKSYSLFSKGRVGQRKLWGFWAQNQHSLIFSFNLFTGFLWNNSYWEALKSGQKWLFWVSNKNSHYA